MECQDSSGPLAGVDTSFSVQPRVGFAWDMKGSGETVLRGGFGSTIPMTLSSVCDLVDFGAGLRSFSRDAERASLSRGLEGWVEANVVFNGNTIDIRDDKQPKTYSWSLTANQKLPCAMNIEVGYVGNKSTDLRISTSPTSTRSGPTARGPCRNMGTSTSSATAPPELPGIHALAASAETSTLRWRTVLQGTRDRSGIGAARRWPPSNLFPNKIPERQLRRAHYDRLTWPPRRIPGSSRSTEGFAKTLLGGWQVAGISTYVSGAPCRS